MITKECDMRLKISIYYLDGFAVPDCVKIMQYGNCKEHNHMLEESDRFKHNTKLWSVAGEEMQKRYRACDIKDVIKSNNNPTASTEFEAAGGQFFNIFNVHNAGKEWKKLNPNPTLLGAKLDMETQWLELAEYFKGGMFLIQIQ